MIIQGDALRVLREMKDCSVHMAVTSPPYYGLRKYGTEPMIWDGDPNCNHEWGEVHPPGHRSSDTNPGALQSEGNKNRENLTSNVCCKCGAWKGELGLEPTPELYVKHLVEIFREMRRVLRDDGTFWLNIGDSYAGCGIGHKDTGKAVYEGNDYDSAACVRLKIAGCKSKDMIGVPWMLAFALRADGWYLRADLPWIKRNSMPSSVTDRPASSIEHVFLFSKSRKYYYDHIATMQPSSESYNKDKRPRGKLRQCVNPNSKYPDEGQFKKQDNVGNNTYTGFNARYEDNGTGLRFMRDSDFFFRTWQGLLHNEDGEPMALVVNPRGYKGAHFACVDTETECLTISGWKRHDQLRVGDDIFTYNMKTGNLELQPLQGMVSYRYTGNLISVFGRSTNMLMTPNHRCVVTTRDKKVNGGRHPAKIVEAANLKGGMKFPVAAPLSFEPYGSFYRKEFYELLGWVLSEGYYKDTGSIGLTQSLSANPEKCERISWLLKELDMPHRMYTRTRPYKEKQSVECEWHITGWARAKIRQILPDKYRIPESFLLLPDECVDAFLEGFVGGDGHVRPDERITITQKEKQPLDIIQAMFIRMGRSCILSQRGNGQWSAFVTNAKDRCFKDSTGSIVDREYPYDGLVWCPTVANGTWVARRGGRPFITGNCFPIQLVEPMILASTSEMGVCPACGAPWKRIVKKVGEFQRRWSKENADGSPYNSQSSMQNITDTIGWQPTCKCGINPISTDMCGLPATVLDPFAGSSATGVACDWHKRNYIGIELNPEYCNLGNDRIVKEGKTNGNGKQPEKEIIETSTERDDIHGATGGTPPGLLQGNSERTEITELEASVGAPEVECRCEPGSAQTDRRLPGLPGETNLHVPDAGRLPSPVENSEVRPLRTEGEIQGDNRSVVEVLPGVHSTPKCIRAVFEPALRETHDPSYDETTLHACIVCRCGTRVWYGYGKGHKTRPKYCPACELKEREKVRVRYEDKVDDAILQTLIEMEVRRTL